MSDKEASVFIVDLGQSMSKKRHGREESDLEYSLQYFYDKVTNIVYTGRKTLFIGVIGLRTDETKNHMQEEGGYENITNVQSITNMLMPELQSLPQELTASNTDSGDSLSAVILGVDMLMKHCKTLKFIKRLYLITNGSGPLDPDDIEQTAGMIKQNGIQLTVLGVDFDDPEYGFKEENKPYQKEQNEKSLRKLVDLSDGVYGTMDEAIEGLSRPYIKPVRPIASYKGQLRLGGPNYDTTITIDVERYPKVMVRKPPTASAYVLKDSAPSQQQPADGEANGNEHFSNVRTAYAYRVKDEDSPTGYREIAREDLAKGYEYGRTAVHIAESEENITKLETEQAYEILGFIPQENVERYMLLENSCMLVAGKTNDKATLALSSLIHALYEVGSVAIARLVRKAMAEPQLTMLSAYITADVECLIENDLPFAEDLRTYRFPPLDKVVTVSGKSLTAHRNLPSDDLLSTMSDFVDKMSLVNKDIDPPDERFAVEDTFSPLLHTIEGNVKYRAVRPDGAIQPTPDRLLEPSRIPPDLLDSAKPSLDRLIKSADVKKVPPKVKGRARYRDREAEKPISGLDIDALLKKSKANNDASGAAKKTVHIDPKNAIPEFKRLVEHADDEDIVRSGVKQMGGIIETLIKNSFGDQNYSQAIEMLGVVRSEMVDFEWPQFYNDLIRQVKDKLLKDELAEGRREFWWRVRMARLGVVDDEESESSKVGREEAREFMALKS